MPAEGLTYRAPRPMDKTVAASVMKSPKAGITGARYFCIAPRPCCAFAACRSMVIGPHAGCSTSASTRSETLGIMPIDGGQSGAAPSAICGRQPFGANANSMRPSEASVRITVTRTASPTA